jgi:hypothetical protein
MIIDRKSSIRDCFSIADFEGYLANSFLKPQPFSII